MKNSERVYADIGFDVLHDGEKHHRVNKGILFEFVDDDTMYVHLSPGDRTMFYEIMDGLFDTFKENGWLDDFLGWKVMKEIKEKENGKNGRKS